MASNSSSVHQKARVSPYYMTKIQRQVLKDSEVPWSVNMPSYNPPSFTVPEHVGPNRRVYADDDIVDGQSSLPHNQVDRNMKVDRTSFEGPYQVVDGKPVNIRGRTGLAGRGTLGRWGPNHAADPIVTRWKRDPTTKKVVTDSVSGKPLLQFVGIKRMDTLEWAITGGMVDPGENVSRTLYREFGEEALNTLECSEEKKKSITAFVKAGFTNGVPIYEGYVDDIRNTDNAWMETTAVNFHDETGDTMGQFPLSPGEEANSVAWVTIKSDLPNLFASHKEFIKKVAMKHNAHW